MNLSPFEHHFIRIHKQHFESSRNFLLAVSGGVDSMVLLHLFYKFKQQMKCQFRVIYVHHGFSANQDVLDFRDKSLAVVQSACEKLNLKFLTNYPSEGSPQELTTEQSLREFRYNIFKQHQREDEILTLAHHLDDLLETKLMDLIRGSHFEHWSQHKEQSESAFRPLANVSKEDILKYAKEKNLKWVEDPTNQNTDTLRNWLRNGFIHDLTAKSLGLKENLMKNLNKLYEFNPILAPVAELEVDTAKWMTMTESDKRQFVLRSAIRLGLKSMTQGQILDILRKLDLGQKEIKFQTGPIFWSKTTDKLQAYRETP